MTLNDQQKAAVAEWVNEGLSLSDIQKRIEEHFSLRLTYMDVRFLVDDLDLEVKAAGPKFDAPKQVSNEPTAPADGTVSVTIDKVARPDALASGQVRFSDGVSATWTIDQMGRLGLNPSQPGYKPSQEDLMEFQTALQDAARKAGLF